MHIRAYTVWFKNFLHTCTYLPILAYTYILHTYTYTCNIHAYTCTYLQYVHIRSAVCARICAKMKYVYARMLYVYCAVFARICTYCTYMHVFFVRKVVRRIDVRIIAHTCIYLQIRTQIRANTCKYVRTYVQKFKDPVRFQRSYMHVYARICTYISTWYAYMDTYERRSYMQVYACICMYVTYMHVYCTYMHVFSAMIPWNTGVDANSPKHIPYGRQPAGPTQGTPRHLGMHFFPS